MKKHRTTVGICSVLAAIILIAFAVPISNNLCAYMVEKKLLETPFPEQTVVIESVSRAGKLTGNGNEMQYFGAILIQSELTMEQLEDFYSNYRENRWEYHVAPQFGCDIAVVEHERLHFSKEAADDGYYIVYSWGQGVELLEMMDIRGH